jgi:hypothetical protein
MKIKELAELADSLAATTKAHVAKATEPLLERIAALEAADQQKAYRLRQLETTAEADAIRIKALEQLLEPREDGYANNRRYVPQ